MWDLQYRGELVLQSIWDSPIWDSHNFNKITEKLGCGSEAKEERSGSVEYHLVPKSPQGHAGVEVIMMTPPEGTAGKR